jgi:hypothetical protein
MKTYYLISILECLVSGDVVNTTTSISRYLNTLRVLFPSNDIGVMELAARTLVKLGQLPGSKGVESFEYDIKQAFEFISDERNEVNWGEPIKQDQLPHIACYFFRANAMQPLSS